MGILRGKIEPNPQGDQGMSWWDGFSPCMTPGVDQCVVWWDAWAVVAAVFAGVGSWIAAAITVAAVLVPIWRRKNEGRAVAAAAMDDFAVDLIELRDKMGGVSLSLSMVKPNVDAVRANSAVRGLSRHIAVPILNATPETLALVQMLNRLRRAVSRWNETVAAFDLTYDPELGGAFLEYQVDELHSVHRKLMDEIRNAATLIKPMVPCYADQLDLIINSGNGFLVMLHPPDVL